MTQRLSEALQAPDLPWCDGEFCGEPEINADGTVSKFHNHEIFRVTDNDFSIYEQTETWGPSGRTLNKGRITFISSDVLFTAGPEVAHASYVALWEFARKLEAN
ncbi:hypothetical protein CFP71_01335 [Amycolatopsis thailandensis]|uniref:Uncharacterized protein n=1 Tax=Amycolatopsis thailandensis TaxID=589330 RepID=A0A229SIH5_9PSEU|nr:hypothetical protein CFP71_01335 [Amycolatopsis thailandensis]